MKKMVLGVGLMIMGVIGESTQRLISAIFIAGNMRSGDGFSSTGIASFLAVAIGVGLCIVAWREEKK